MFLFKLIIYFLSIFIPGYWLVLLIFNKEQLKFLQLLAYSYGLGSFFITIQLFLYFFVFRLPFSYWLYVIIIENILLIFLVLKKAGLFHSFNFDYKFWKKIKVKEAIIILLIIIQVLFVFSNALARPTVVYDSIAMWVMKAKILYTENAVNFDPDSSMYLGGGYHRNYPWHIPLISYWLFTILGESNDLLVNLIFVFYFISLLIVCYYFLKSYISRFYSLVFVFFLSSMPLVFYHGFNAYADLTLSFYLFISFAFLFSWLKNKEFKHLALAGIFSGLSFFVKNEAIIYIIASLVTILLLAVINKNWRKIKYLFCYVLFAALPILPWLIFKVWHNLGVRNVKEGLGFHPEIFKSFFGNMFTSNSWNIWWLIVLVFLIINMKKIIKNRALLLGWIFLLLIFTGFIILYLFTEQYYFALDNTAIARNILTLVPVSVFVTAVSFSKINKTS